MGASRSGLDDQGMAPRRIALALSSLLVLGLGASVLGGATATAAPPPVDTGLPDLPAQAPPAGQEGAAFGRGQLHSHGPDGLELGRGAGGTPAAQAVDQTLQSSTWTQTSALPVVSTDQADRFAGFAQVHLVYLHPSDKAPRTDFLRMFSSDARSAADFLQVGYGRSVRFDERVDRTLDITTVKSRYTAKQLGSSNQFDLVKRELGRVFPDSSAQRKKYVAWLDAPSRYCGQGELYGDWHRDRENHNDLRTTGVVYRPYSVSGTDGGFCRGRTLLHELGHNLGAIYGQAPNAFDGAHCNDDKNDVMCYAGSVASGNDTSPTSRGQFDFGHDDYWDLGASASSANDTYTRHLNWWGANLSRFVCRPSVAGGIPHCDDPATQYPTDAELRYHSGADAYPPPTSVPVG